MSNMFTLQVLEIMPHHTPQDILYIRALPEGSRSTQPCCFPFLVHWRICQNFLKTKIKFSMASPKLFSHTCFCFHDCQRCSPSHLPVSVCCFRRPTAKVKQHSGLDQAQSSQWSPSRYCTLHVSVEVAKQSHRVHWWHLFQKAKQRLQEGWVFGTAFWNISIHNIQRLAAA